MEKTFLISKEQFLTMKAAWAKKSTHAAYEIILYNLLRSLPLGRGFVAKTKAIQGNDEWFAYHQALKQARYWIDKKETKEEFGIDIPAEFKELLKG